MLPPLPIKSTNATDLTATGAPPPISPISPLSPEKPRALTTPSPQKYPPQLRSQILPTDFPHQVSHLSQQVQQATDRSRLAPEDAIYHQHISPPQRRESQARPAVDRKESAIGSGNGHAMPNMNGGSTRPGCTSAEHSRSRGRHKDRGSTSRGRKGRKAVWKKLLWVKQSYPDNYTDSATFLEQLQRNPRLQPYDFWPLVADSTVIVQQVCAVTIFICCFVAIYQERIEPLRVVSSSTCASVLAWFVWDRWVRKEQNNPKRVGSLVAVTYLPLPPSPAVQGTPVDGTSKMSASISSTTSLIPAQAGGRPQPGSRSNSHSGPLSPSGLGLEIKDLTSAATAQPPKHSYSTSASSLASFDTPPRPPPPRPHSRISTLKSAVLIYCALLGLSPILKSLTRSTSSDSIWALSTWLMTINVFFFDYTDLDLRPTFQASLSTNAALMASTVLASRLPSTQHVFSLTLFSIEVFGLFPVFRRHLRQQSWRGHVFLTAALVMGAGAGVGVVVSGGEWKAAIVGGTLGNGAAALAMGGCSWWLIGLQRYKNEIHGPWDPARPVVRGWVDG